jgi:hypothetical protein
MLKKITLRYCHLLVCRILCVMCGAGPKKHGCEHQKKYSRPLLQPSSHKLPNCRNMQNWSKWILEDHCNRTDIPSVKPPQVSVEPIHGNQKKVAKEQ